MLSDETTPTRESQYLFNLARSVAGAYERHTAPRAVLLTGSVAEGISDRDSDIDLIAYYDRSPTTDELAAAREALGEGVGGLVTRRPPQQGIPEEYALRGVEVQIGLETIAAWEANLVAVLDDHTPGTLIEKAIMGLVSGQAIRGPDLIGQWQRRAATYPDGLASATVAHYLPGIVPLWLSPERWAPRDATIFWHQTLAESSLRLLGVLAGLNRQYFSTFQMKRLRRLTDELTIVPEGVADRLDDLFGLDPLAAGDELERLTAETIALVETHLPSVDTSVTCNLLGQRLRPWQPSPRWSGSAQDKK